MAEYTRILLRQGPDKEKNNVILRSGEPAYITDFERLVVGNGVTGGGVTIGSKFLGFTTFDTISLEVFDVKPGYSGDLMFETSTNLLYVLSGTETILGKKAYQIKTNYLPINKTPNPDEITITNSGGALSLAIESIDARYIAEFALGNGLQKNPINPTILEMKTPSPELQFLEGVLQITDGGVNNTKLADMRANSIKARLNASGPPEDISFDELKRSLGLSVDGSGAQLGVPVGTIIDFAGSNPPSNYMPCDGREVPINDYVELYGALGDLWGRPSLSSFNIPNLNRRTTIGLGSISGTSSSSNVPNTVGSYGGLEFNQITPRNLPPHIHKVSFTIPQHKHTVTLSLPQYSGSFNVTDIITNGYNNYITVINGRGPDAVQPTIPAGADANSYIRSEASLLIKQNKAKLQQRVVDYVLTNYPYALTAFYTDSVGNTGLPLSAVCYRDSGYIIDSYAADILNNANHRSVETGNLYFSGFITTQKRNYPGSNIPALPLNQILPTIMSIEAIGSFIAGINIPLDKRPTSNTGILSSLVFFDPAQGTVVAGLRNFTSVISNSASVPVTEPSNPIPLETTYYTAASTISNNKSNLQQRVVEFVKYNYPMALSGNNELNSDQLSAKCFRDSGYIIDSIAADILNNANHRSIETGLFYFSGAMLARQSNLYTSVPTLPQDQVNATIQAISAIGKFITGLEMPTENKYTTHGLLSSQSYFNPSQLVLLSGLNNFTRVISNSANVPKTTPNGTLTVPNISSAAIDILINKTKLQQQVVEFVKYYFPVSLSGVDALQSDALSAKCFRDTGYIIESIAADLNNQANHRSVETGMFYFSGAVLARQNNMGSSVPTLPVDQVQATITAISALGVYINGNNIPALPTPFTSTGVLSSSAYNSVKPFVSNLVDVMTYPLRTNGDRVEYSPAGNPSNEDVVLGNTILNNRNSIQRTVSGYVFEKAYLSPPLDNSLVEKCNRDVGFMVDAIANDLITGVNAKSVQYAVAYWDGSTSRLNEIDGTVIQNQRKNTIDTIEYLQSVMLDYLATEPTSILNEVVDLSKTMSYPLKNAGQLPEYRPKGDPITPGRQDAVNLLINNRSSLQSKTRAYVKTLNIINGSSQDRITLQEKCNRDVGYMVDSIINDLKTGVNARSTQFALSYWDGTKNRLSGNSKGSPNQVAATIATIRYLRDQSISLILNNGVNIAGNVPITTTTSMSGEESYDGFTGSGAEQLYNEPVSNMQPTAVVNKCIKAK